MRTTTKWFLSVTLMTAGIAVRADGLADLGAKMHELSGTKPPALFLTPGSRLKIAGQGGGKVVEVFGLDKCPDGFMSQWAGRDGCTFLDKPAVTVRYVEDRKVITEHWKVATEGTRIRLTRQNGAVVARAD